MTIVEVLVAAVVVVTAGLATMTAVDAASHSGAEERHHAQAAGVAQQDQARMQSMRIADLANLNQTRTVTVGGNNYTVQSRGDFVTDDTGTASCDSNASADYIKITSTVSWASKGSRPPVVAESIVTPPAGSIDADHGALAIEVDDATATGIQGIDVNGTGPSSFHGTTSALGCVLVGDIFAGDYTITASGLAAGLVDVDGNAPGPVHTSVVGQSTNTLGLQYDRPGSLTIDFTTMIAGILTTTKADSVMVFNTGMTAAKKFGTVGSPVASITASSLFPFSSPDTVYAGACSGDNPNPGDLDPPPVPQAIASTLVPPGGSGNATIQLPSLNLKVLGAGSLPILGAHVVVTDTVCGTKRTLTTSVLGLLTNPGLPYGTYDICADNGVRKMVRTNYSVTDMSAIPPLLTMLLTSGGGASLGVCT